jgi:hypothetical protein
MNFPKFWAKGKSGDFAVWHWSDWSIHDARSGAQAAADRLAAQLAAGQLSNRYGYGDRPMREPVLREMRNAAGEVTSVVTRNSYGCQVLNSAVALFVDVDFPEKPPQRGGFLGSLFGSRTAEAEDSAKAGIAKASAWAQSHPGWNWRIYRTKGGLRLLATHKLFDPSDPVCERVFSAVDADPLYRKLCQTQKCFRARLTPKPWRCKLPNVPARWPFENAVEEDAFGNWDAKYQTASRTMATCQLLDQGSGVVHAELRETVALHDEMTRALSPGYELA